MAQWTDVDLITASDDGVDVANQINNLRDAFTTGSSGATRPTNALAGMIYSKTVAGGFQPVMITGAGTEVAMGEITTATGVYALPIDVIEAALTSSGRGVPSGTVIMHAANTAPTGYLKCNGAAVSRTTYSDLFDEIGTIYGTGDGSTTFNLPDFRGEFPRGWDDGRGVDSGRVFGSAQGQRVGSHAHKMPLGFDATRILMHGDASDQPIFGSEVVTGARRSDVTHSGFTSGQSVRRAFTDTPIDPVSTDDNRPRNVATLFCIKF